MKCIVPDPRTTRPSAQAHQHFPGTLASARQARVWAVETLTTWGIEPPQMLTLVISELATNARDHSKSGLPGRHFTIGLCAHPEHIRILVQDAGPLPGRTPTRQALDPEATHGRGLALVQALCLGWGALATGTGVWAEIAR